MQHSSTYYLHCYIAGLQYYEVLEVWKELEIGNTLDLTPEPDNRYDKHAIIVSYKGKNWDTSPEVKIEMSPKSCKRDTIPMKPEYKACIPKIPCMNGLRFVWGFGVVAVHKADPCQVGHANDAHNLFPFYDREVAHFVLLKRASACSKPSFRNKTMGWGVMMFRMGSRFFIRFGFKLFKNTKKVKPSPSIFSNLRTQTNQSDFLTFDQELILREVWAPTAFYL